MGKRRCFLKFEEDVIPLEVSRIDCMKVYTIQMMLWIAVWVR
jgi:hypothetical protein